MEGDILFVVSLKLHICSYAARNFEKMHQAFITENDPFKCVNRDKDRFLDDFKDLYHAREQDEKIMRNLLIVASSLQWRPTLEFPWFQKLLMKCCQAEIQ